MAPTFTEHPSQPIVSTKSSWDLSPFTSKESKSSRNIIIYRVEQVFTKISKIKLLKPKAATPKRTSIATDSGYDDSLSPESPRSSDPSLPAEKEIEVAELAVTELDIAELEAEATKVVAPVLDPSPCVSNRPDSFCSGVRGRPGSQWSYGNRPNGGAHYPSMPGHTGSAMPTIPPQPAQYGVAPRSFHDPDFASTPQRATFQYNETNSSDVQVVGVDIGATYQGEADLREKMANFVARWNVQSGTGDQIIGQRVNQGAGPMWIAGDYSNNRNINGGEQIIGVQLR
ncbi:hypothetical protein F5Y03DRAFT_149320 [Xylaria venustula]|nr:hypothetical protein F5Y03DRAFT_149320 [Xylaria venustula]